MSKQRSTPRITLRVSEEAATALGISADAFDQHVRPHLRLIRLGRLVLVSVAELERWASDEAGPALSEELGLDVCAPRPNEKPTS